MSFFVREYPHFALFAIPFTAFVLLCVIAELARLGRYMARHSRHEPDQVDGHIFLATVAISLLITEIVLVELQTRTAPTHFVDTRLRDIHWAIDAGMIVMLACALFYNGRSRYYKRHKFFVYPFMALLVCSMITGAFLEYPFYTRFL